MPTPATLHDGLAIYRFGIGEPIFFMPGPHRFQRPGERSADTLIDGLVHLDRQPITYDPPQSGHSTRPANLSMDEMLRCAAETLDVCDIHEPVDALGHSMGGLALLAFALKYPKRIKRLILVCTGPGNSYVSAPGSLANRSHPAFWKMATYGLFHILLPTLAAQKLMFNFIERQSFQDHRYLQLETIRFRDWLRPRVGRTDWHRIAKTLDYAPRLSEITAPTLVLGSRHDPEFPLACAQELADHIPDARFEVFENSGHYPFIEEADAFWSSVSDFLG